jgi:hypothetical protein
MPRQCSNRVTIVISLRANVVAIFSDSALTVLTTYLFDYPCK